MLIVRAQLFTSPAERISVALLSDASGHLVLARRGEGAAARARITHQGVVLQDALAAFASACRSAERALGRGPNAQAPDARLERWLDRLATVGELPSADRPRPPRSLPAAPVDLVLGPAPEGVIWQAHPSGRRAALLTPASGSAILALWAEGGRLGEILDATTDHPDASLLVGAGRLPRATTLDAILLPDRGSGPALVVIDLLRYAGEDISNQPTSVRLGLLHQLWEEMAQGGSAPAGWRLAATRADQRPATGPAGWSWRQLAAPYEKASGWGRPG